MAKDFFEDFERFARMGGSPGSRYAVACALLRLAESHERLGLELADLTKALKTPRT